MAFGGSGMKTWLRNALDQFLLDQKSGTGPFFIHFFSGEDYEIGEHQARKFAKAYLSEGSRQDLFVRYLKKHGYLSEKYYCTSCRDSTCQCGGIGLSCHGCCDCRHKNPIWKMRHDHADV